MMLSFIVPAFNAELTLAKCLDSILEQPYADLEVIVVNDGSTDETQTIIDQYLAKDRRVRAIAQQNSGQGAARSVGLAQASGKYIWFVDSDDWLLPCVLPRIVAILKQSDPDVLVTNFEYAYDNSGPKPSGLVPPFLAGKTVTPSEDGQTFAALSCWNTPPWRLVSRREHLKIHGIDFPRGYFYEDHPFAIHLMLTAKRVFVDPSVSYAYYQRQTATTKVNDHKALDFLTIRTLCLDLFKRFDKVEAFSGIVAGYIIPANFYLSHVSGPYQATFIQRLKDETEDEDLSFAAEFGDESIKAMAEAVRRNDPSLISQKFQLTQNKPRVTKAKAMGKVRKAGGRLKRRFKRVLDKFRTSKRHGGGNSAPGGGLYPYLQAGVGTRVDPIYIDVRVQREDRPYVTVGDNSQIGGTYVFERGLGSVTIGSKSSIGGGCKFICTQEGGIHIGSNTMISWDCTLIDTNAHSLDPEIRANDAYDWKVGLDAGQIGIYKDWSQVASAPIYIGDNVWIGFETAIMKGVTIGNGAVIGARSMVTHDVAPYCVYAGSPAKFVRYVPRGKWTWEDIIHAAHGNPEMEKTLRDAFLHKDMVGSLRMFMASEEFQLTLKEFRKYAPNARRILDVGGSGGVMTVAFAKAGYHVTLIEPSSDTIVGTEAAARLRDAIAYHEDTSIMDRINIVHGFVEDFSPEKPFDIVYCRQVVHHFEDPVVSLRKIRDVLTDDGTVFLVREHVIFDDEDKRQFLDGHPLHRFTQGENAYTREQYEGFVKEAELDLLQVFRFADTPINYFPHSKEVVEALGENAYAGRPYTFIARKEKPKL